MEQILTVWLPLAHLVYYKGPQGLDFFTDPADMVNAFASVACGIESICMVRYLKA